MPGPPPNNRYLHPARQELKLFVLVPALYIGQVRKDALIDPDRTGGAIDSRTGLESERLFDSDLDRIVHILVEENRIPGLPGKDLRSLAFVVPSSATTFTGTLSIC